jgi:hypothetical protein
VGGTRQRRFGGPSLQPDKLLENAQTSTTCPGFFVPAALCSGCRDSGARIVGHTHRTPTDLMDYKDQTHFDLTLPRTQPLSNSTFISSSAKRNALSLFRCNVCWEVPSVNFACALSVLLIIEANARRASCKSSRVKRSVSSLAFFISADAMCNALRLSRSIVCCHVPGASFCCAFSDLLISEAIGRSASCNSSVV